MWNTAFESGVFSVSASGKSMDRTFRDAWCATGADPAAAADVLATVQTSYSEPWRHYHTLEHITECLGHYAEIRESARHPADLLLAIWFHDWVYEPERRDNEAASADRAEAALLRAGGRPESIGRIVSWVRSTADHSADLSGDAALLSDIDLAILGATAERYRVYEEQVRAEYAFVPADRFRAGRAAFLREMLDRPLLYHHPAMTAALDVAARRNMREALDRLTRGMGHRDAHLP